MKFEDKDGLQESLGAFEAALVKRKVDMSPPVLKRILLAVDRSNQDRTAILLAAHLADRLHLPLSVIYADGEAASPEGQSYATGVVDELRAAPWQIEATLVHASAPLPAHQILAAQNRTSADLIVLPAPYLRDIGLLGDESLSDTVDMVLAETSVPVLLARQPLEAPEKVFEEILVALAVHLEEGGLAARWALALMEPKGHARLLAVADETMIKEAEVLLGHGEESQAAREEMLKRAEMREVGAVTAAVQRHAEQHGLQVTVDVRVGHAAQLVAGEANARPCLVCCGAPSDRTAPAFHRAQDILLRAHNPVLVV